MQSISDFFDALLNGGQLIHYGGLTLVIIIIFVETGLFFGFFLPGDYLLFTAGLLCGTKDFHVAIITLLLSVTAAAIAGDIVGFFSGKWAGPKLFKREDSWIFKKSYLERTKSVFVKYGAGSLIIGRFFPIIRTFAPILAGATNMEWKKFLVYNISGAILWVWSMILLGYFLGVKYPQIIEYLEFIILGFMLVTGFAVLRTYLKMRRDKK